MANKRVVTARNKKLILGKVVVVDNRGLVDNEEADSRVSEEE